MYPTDLDTCKALLDAAALAGDHERVAALIAHIDKVDEALVARLTAPGALAAAALWYARAGHHIFPLAPGTKIPRKGSNGLKDATTDIGIVKAWWLVEPQANIGGATGITFDVVDIDGPAGYHSWRIDPGFDIPDVIGISMTPRGQHLFVPPVPDRGNTAAIVPGVDTRGTGGYVVLPPSRIDGKRYSWARPLAAA